MKLYEHRFTEYYHKYVVFEADDLTDLLKEEIRVSDRDCYALCSSYIAPDGFLEFNVLAIGNDWDSCTKGLRFNKMLGIFTADQVCEKEMRVIEPSMRMIEKNFRFLLEKDAEVDEDLLQVRLDARLDPVRDLFYPDHVLTGLIKGPFYREYEMRVTGIKGPFLAGFLNEEPQEEIDVHEDDPLWALPCYIGTEFRLLALFAGERMSKEEKEIMDQILQVSDRYGIDFNGVSIKN